jgi:hypothetical protein
MKTNQKKDKQIPWAVATVTPEEIVWDALRHSKPRRRQSTTTTPEGRLASIKRAIRTAGTPPLGAQKNKGEKTIAFVKLADAATGWAWYITEFSEMVDGVADANLAYGLVKGFAVEAGYVSFRDLAAFPNVVVDQTFKPTICKTCLQEIEAES